MDIDLEAMPSHQPCWPSVLHGSPQQTLIPQGSSRPPTPPNMAGSFGGPLQEGETNPVPFDLMNKSVGGKELFTFLVVKYVGKLNLYKKP